MAFSPLKGRANWIDRPMFNKTRFWDGPSSALGDEFARHAKGNETLGAIERGWLDAMDEREKSDIDAKSWLLKIRSRIRLASRDDPQGDQEILDLIESARDVLYPASTRLLRELQGASEVGRDDTLDKIDRAVVRRLDDRAVTDPSSKTFRDDFLKRLSEPGSKRGSNWASGVYEVFGEALVYEILQTRLKNAITIKKIPETDRSSPDFKCTWHRSTGPVTFYIEVKSLDVVGGAARLAEARNEAFESELDIDRQLTAGKRVASTIRVLAPYRKLGDDKDYDPWSIRCMVERIGAKLAGAFGGTQFERGPTFAFASLLRLEHMHQGPQALMPRYQSGRAWISGAWWTLAFGELDRAVHREPEFEGAKTDDGALKRAGFLVDKAVALSTSGLLLLFNEKKAERIVGLKALRQPRFPGWDDGTAREVLDLICDAWNDKNSSRPQKESWE